MYHYAMSVYQHGEIKDVEKVAKICDLVAKWATSTELSRNLNLCGSVGIGKSTFLGSFRDFLNESEYLYSKVMITANTMADIALNSEPSWERITTVPILLLDDVGTEPYEVKEYGNSYLPFTELMEQRYNRNLITVITTNLTIEDIHNRYGARIADRVNEFHTIKYNRESYRKG